MRKQIVLLAKKMTACGLAAAMLFGVGPFDKVTTSKSAAADELEMLVDKELWPFPSYGDLVSPARQ